MGEYRLDLSGSGQWPVAGSWNSFRFHKMLGIFPEAEGLGSTEFELSNEDAPSQSVQD